MKNKIYEKGTLGWLRGQVKKDGFDNIRDWQNWKIYEKDLENIDCAEKIAKKNNMDIKDKLTFYRFWGEVNIKDNVIECWNWMDSLGNQFGHGRFWDNKKVYSHRMAYMLTKGWIRSSTYL